MVPSELIDPSEVMPLGTVKADPVVPCVPAPAAMTQAPAVTGVMLGASAREPLALFGAAVVVVASSTAVSTPRSTTTIVAPP